MRWYSEVMSSREREASVLRIARGEMIVAVRGFRERRFFLG